ncbi:MAG: TAXI family TRAP transporter solute-binding subunit [bacterium]
MRMFRLILAAGLVASTAGLAMAQSAGMGITKRAYTSQAGAAIAKVVSQNTSIRMRTQTFGGSSAYVPAVNAGQLEFGLANELETTFAVAGTKIYKGRPMHDLRIVTVLTPFRVAIWVRDDSPIKKLSDLRGKRVPSGWASQKIIGVLMNGYLANAGLSYDDVVKVPVPNVVAGANDFASGKSDAFFFVFGAGKVSETAAKVGKIRVLGISSGSGAVERMRRHVPPAYALTVRPSKRNVGVNKPLDVMAYDYLVITGAKVSDSMVYSVAKTMHDKSGELAKAFPALRLFSPNRMAKKFKGLTYHPGAVKYYRELGVWPPK